MGQADILKLLDQQIKTLEKNIKQASKDEEILEILWKQSFSKSEIVELLGTSLKSVGVALGKLHARDQIIKLKNKKEDSRAVKYVIINEFFNNMDDRRNNK